MERNSNRTDDSPGSWLTESHRIHRSCQSGWLHSTLSEADDKVKTILNLIGGVDGDTFAVRAEMYHQKRPQLIEMVQDLHRSYCALANKHNLLKSHGISIASPNLYTKSLEGFSSDGSNSYTSPYEFYSPKNLIVSMGSIDDLMPDRVVMQENEQTAIREKALLDKEEEMKTLRNYNGIIPGQEVNNCSSSSRHEIEEMMRIRVKDMRILRDNNTINDESSPRHKEGTSKGKKLRKNLVKKLLCMVN